MTDCQSVMAIQLSVSEKYEVPLLVRRNDPKTNEEVLSLGSSMYEEKRRLLLASKDRSLTMQLQENYESKLQQIALEQAAEVKRHQASNNDLEENVQRLKQKLSANTEELIESGYKKASQECDKLMKEKADHVQFLEKELEESKRTLSRISERLDKYLGGSVAHGRFDDVKLDQFIRDEFGIGCNVTDTSREGSAGDMRVVYKSLCLMVESKNVDTKQKSGIVKFESDIGATVSLKKINAALFVSYKDTNLYEGQKGFVFHYRHGIPVVYVGNAAENMELVRISIQMLLSLVEHGKTLSDGGSMDEKSEYVLALVKDLYADYQKFSAMLQEDRKILSKMQQQVAKRQGTLDCLTLRFEEAVSKFPDIKDAGTVTSVGRPAVSNKRKRDSSSETFLD